MNGRKHQTARAVRPAYHRPGFSLIEILIVVVILGIIAAIVMPQFSNASSSARENVLKDELRYLRTQLVIYKSQHGDVPPGYPGGNTAAGPTEAAFIAQMTQYTDMHGGVSATYSDTYRYGPYLSRMPANPLNGLSSIRMILNGEAMPATADGLTGWIYKAQTQEIAANVVGNDSNGKPFIEY